MKPFVSQRKNSWYGGHPKSQKFNAKFSEESCLNDEDTISKLAKPLLHWYSNI